MVSNHPKGLIVKAKTIVAHDSAAAEDKLAPLGDDELSALSDAFVMVVKSFRDATSALEETTRRVASSSGDFLCSSKELYACAEAIKDIEKTTKSLKENARAGDYGNSLEIVVDNVRKLTEDSCQIAERIDALTSEIVINVNRHVSALQDSIGNEASNSEEFIASVEEVSSAIDEMVCSTDEISAGSQEIARLGEFLSEMATRLP